MYQVTPSDHSNKVVFPVALQYLGLKNGISNFLILMKILVKLQKTRKEKIVDILSKYIL